MSLAAYDRPSTHVMVLSTAPGIALLVASVRAKLIGHGSVIEGKTSESPVTTETSQVLPAAFRLSTIGKSITTTRAALSSRNRRGRDCAKGEGESDDGLSDHV